MQQATTPTRREREWAATMAGHRHGERAVRLAHGSANQLGPAALPMAREEREAAEDAVLVQGATRALGAGERARPEEPDPLRTCFERDRDRILHSTAFRRLAGKTQVFVFPDDHQRTRLTHALEVAQVSRAIATALRCNVALAEAIALGHDCGHGPGGHASEEAFSQFVPEGFDHAVWGADVVLAPLNLTVEVLDGIRNHSWSRPAPGTAEGDIVSWADRIAYVCHDFEDAVQSGIVGAGELPAAVREACGPTRGAQLGAFIDGVIDGTAALGKVAMTEELADALEHFRAFDYERIYLRPESRRQAAGVIGLLTTLVERLVAEPWRIPATSSPADASTVAGGGAPPAPFSEGARRSAVTWVAGMTDRFAVARASELAEWPADGLQGVAASSLRGAAEQLSD